MLLRVSLRPALEVSGQTRRGQTAEGPPRDRCEARSYRSAPSKTLALALLLALALVKERW